MEQFVNHLVASLGIVLHALSAQVPYVLLWTSDKNINKVSLWKYLAIPYMYKSGVELQINKLCNLMEKCVISFIRRCDLLVLKCDFYDFSNIYIYIYISFVAAIKDDFSFQLSMNMLWSIIWPINAL